MNISGGRLLADDPAAGSKVPPEVFQAAIVKQSQHQYFACDAPVSALTSW